MRASVASRAQHPDGSLPCLLHSVSKLDDLFQVTAPIKRGKSMLCFTRSSIKITPPTLSLLLVPALSCFAICKPSPD